MTINALSAICAFIAAILWFVSSKSGWDIVKIEEDCGKKGLVSPEQLNSPSFIAAQKRQTQFNFYASIAAGFAALFQSFALFIK